MNNTQEITYDTVDLEPYGSTSGQTGIIVKNFSFSEENMNKFVKNQEIKDEIKN